MNSIKNIERIERYLNNKMNTAEINEFEQELTSNPQLQNDIKEYKQLIKGLKHRSWKLKAQRAYTSYKFLKAIKWFSLSLIVASLAGLSIFLLRPSKEQASQLIIIKTPLAEKAIDTSWHLPNETFSINTNEESVIETQNGTIIAIPKNAFVDEHNNPIQGQVDFKITEAFNPLDIMKAGLSTTSDGKLLETAGMFNLEASQEGKKIKISPNKQLVFDVPTKEKNLNMLVFDGEYAEDGTINWINPKKMDNYLKTVDIFTLNFYPPKFEKKLSDLGFRNLSKKVKDSIFYSYYCKEIIEEDFIWDESDEEDVELESLPLSLNDSTPPRLRLSFDDEFLALGENLFNTNCKACHQIHTDAVGPALKGVSNRQSLEWLMTFIQSPSKMIASGDKHAVEMFEKFGSEMTAFPTLSTQEKLAIISYIESQPVPETNGHSAQSYSCGIEPSQIKIIWSRKYQNTLIATKEFEERLAFLYQSCQIDLLQLYISNLDKNLYEIDKMVSNKLSGSLKMKFEHFYARKDGKVKVDSPTLKALNKYYQKKSRANDLAVKKAYNSYWNKQKKLDGIARKKHIIKNREDKQRVFNNFKKEVDINTRSVYKQLGIPYNKIRVRRNSYQFSVSTLGPKNIDAFVINQTVNRATGSYTQNGKTATLTYKKLTIEVSDEDKYDFVSVYLTSNKLSSYMKMKKIDNNYTEKLNDLIEYNLIVIAFKGKQGFITTEKAVKGDQKLTVKLKPKSVTEIKEEVNKNCKKLEFRDIKKDIQFEKFLIQEYNRKKKNTDLRELERELRTVIFPCLQNNAITNMPVADSTLSDTLTD